MPSSETPRSRLRFEGFELDREAGVLFRNGEQVKLPPQPFKVLRTLVESAGRVVPREELKRAVWTDGTHVEFEGSLHSCVKLVRAALQDDAAAPRFIETLPRRGYRFLPKVEAISRRPRWYYLAAPLVLAGAAVLASLAASDRTSKTDSVQQPPLTVLVRPFVNETGDARLDYLGEALAGETLDRLSALDPSKLVVLAPRTAELYEAARPKPAVDYELSGRILGSSEDPSLEVDLLRRSDGARLWRDRIDDGDPVPRMVAGLVPHLVAPGEGREHRSSGLDAAREAYWKGRYLAKENGRESLSRAEHSFREAITLREDWAAPWVGLGEIQLQRAMISGDDGAYAEAAKTAARAIEIEPSGEAQFILALARWFGAWSWDDAGAAFQRAILQSPGLARAHHWYAYYLTGLGRHREAILEIERARALDPLSASVQSDVGWFYYFGGRYEEAIEASRRTLELEPSFLLAQDCILESYLALGQKTEAFSEAKRFLEIAEKASASTSTATSAPPTEWESFWRRRLALAEHSHSPGRPDAYEAAIASLRLGREAEAVRWLRSAVEGRSLWLPVLGVDPRLSKLHSNPELRKLRAAIGLEPARGREGS